MISNGIKLWSSNDPLFFIQAAALCVNKIFDFVELYVVPETFDPETFAVLKNIPVTIHAPHEAHNVNFTHSNKHNQIALQETIRFADFFDSKTIVVHPGSEGSFKIFLKNASMLTDQRIIIENMPVCMTPEFGTARCVGATLAELDCIKQKGFALCLDFGHAIKAALTQKEDYKSYITTIIKQFQPFYFHLTDGLLTTQHDEHLDLGQGEFDLGWIKQTLKKIGNPQLVFETPKKGNTLDNDIANLRFFQNL